MSDLKNILQEEYKKKKRFITPQSLMLMIQEILETPTTFEIPKVKPPPHHSRFPPRFENHTLECYDFSKPRTPGFFFYVFLLAFPPSFLMHFVS